MRLFLLFISHSALPIESHGQVVADSVAYYRNQFVARSGLSVSVHRGNTNIAPENTLATYRAALQMQVDYIEIDVRTTKDRQLVILHDATLHRTTNGTGPVKERTLDELKKLSASNGFDATFRTEQIPTLDEVCQLLADWNAHHTSKTNLYVDCKAVAPEPMIAVLNRYNLLSDAVFYGSDAYLLLLRNVAPTAKLMPSLKKTDSLTDKVALLRPYAFDLSWGEITGAQDQQGIRVFVDLLDENDTSERYVEAARLGVDVIQTDNVVNLYRTVLQNTAK